MKPDVRTQCEGGELNPHGLPHWILSPKVLFFNPRFSSALPLRNSLMAKELNYLTRALFFQSQNAFFSSYCHPTATQFYSMSKLGKYQSFLQGLSIQGLLSYETFCLSVYRVESGINPMR